MEHHRTMRFRLLAGAALLTCSVATAASAQQAPKSDNSVDEVVVTGTLLRRPNLTSASPVAVVDSTELKYQGVTEVETALNRLPQFTADANENASNGADGTARLNLRNLGSNRVLVLVDGRRMLPTEMEDVNFIPSAMVDRVDVVTGGASAVYGSDAVAGVVNFIMKKDLDGFRIDTQYSTAQHTNDNEFARSLVAARGFALPKKNVWDGGHFDVNAALGLNIGDRGNITFYAGYRELKPVTQNTRDYSACGLNLTGDNNSGLVCGGSSNNPWGLFVMLDGPNAGLRMNNSKDGSKTWVPYNSSFLYNYAPDNYIQRSDERYTAGTFAHYDLGKDHEAYGSFMFMDDHTFSQAAPSALFQGTVFPINCDNPLMSAQQAGILCGSAAGTGVSQNTFIGYRLIGPGISWPESDGVLPRLRPNLGLYLVLPI